MLNLNQIKPFFNPDKIDLSKTSLLTALTQGASDYVEHYTNLTLDENAPKGLVQTVADIVTYHFSTRLDIQELKSEDMAMIFNIKYPPSITKRLTCYRRLKW